jgi:predicted S18 family serine protease
MHYDTRKNYLIFFLVVAIFLVGMAIGQYSTMNLKVEKISEVEYPVLKLDDSNKVETKIIAVDTNGEGIAASLVTEIRDGDGLVLVNINDVLADVNAQYSARLAKQITEDLSEKSFNKTDVIFNIITDAIVVGGQSAGSAMTLSLLSLVLEKEINQSVIITGSVDENGTILDAAEIYEKSKAAKKEGGKLMLVPIGTSSNSVEYQKIRRCGNVDLDFFLEDQMDKIYCETRFEERKINIGEEIGIVVKEIENVSEAINYYFV